MEKDIWYLELSDEELSKKIGIGMQTIKKYNKTLIEKGYLEIIEKDGKKIKQFNLI